MIHCTNCQFCIKHRGRQHTSATVHGTWTIKEPKTKEMTISALHIDKHSLPLCSPTEFPLKGFKFSLWQRDLDNKLHIWIGQESWRYCVNDSIKSPLKEWPGFDFLLVTKTNRREKSDTGVGGGLQERGGGVVIYCPLMKFKAPAQFSWCWCSRSLGASRSQQWQHHQT